MGKEGWKEEGEGWQFEMTYAHKSERVGIKEDKEVTDDTNSASLECCSLVLSVVAALGHGFFVDPLDVRVY